MAFSPLWPPLVTCFPRWFKTKHAAWQKLFHGWQNKQNEYRTKMQKKAAEKAQKEAKKLQAAKIAEAKAAAAKAKKEKEEARPAARRGHRGFPLPQPAEEEEKPDPMQVDEEEEEEARVGWASQVDDIGGGMPLYKDFASEDWTLMSLSIILEHLGFYYNRYYGKGLNCKAYGVEGEADLIALAKDCVFVNKDKAW
eukprot:Skav204471  [mRNA]  locus=scaffold5533:95617:101994:- [translate_table: standard]